jgi:uncharacterized protein YqgV (UPF0045/DUF77 family)
MPAPPAEMVAAFTIDRERDQGEGAAEAAYEAARASGLALDTGPQETALAGSRSEVLEALTRVLEAALDAGARSIEVKVELPTQTR